ncbi:membrane-associated HD superfamily phosphohydrolase [Oxalobacteraceae bacterium GrIS 2.11]
MNNNSKLSIIAACFATVVLATGCSSMKTPATADVAVSNAAVNNASSAGGAEYAPLEMRSAREKLDAANAAMAKKDYKKADDLAKAAQADAKLAQSKADTAKAQAAAGALQNDIQVLQEQINHANQ